MTNAFYHPYTSEDFRKDVLESELPVLVEFGADWCGSCHIMHPLLSNITTEYHSRARVVRINADNSKQLVSEYGIRNIPTLLFFRNGEIIDHNIGTIAGDILRSKLNQICNIQS